MRARGKAFEEYRALLVQDVQDYPEAYKQGVREMPSAAADVICYGLTDTEIKRLTRELKRERDIMKRMGQ